MFGRRFKEEFGGRGGCLGLRRLGVKGLRVFRNIVRILNPSPKP